MSEQTLLLLPGMDGTGLLFQWFRRVIPPNVPVRIAEYPPDQVLGYPDLLAIVRRTVGDEPFIVIAESFSGPLAVWLAAERPEQARGVVLCASFVRPPVLPLVCRLAGLVVRGFPAPPALLRWALLDRETPDSVFRALVEAVRRVPPRVLAYRLYSIGRVDCTEALAQLRIPLLYLRAENDRLVGVKALRGVVAARPDARVATVAAPHLLLQCAPDAAWCEIARFMGPHFGWPGGAHPASL